MNATERDAKLEAHDKLFEALEAKLANFEPSEMALRMQKAEVSLSDLDKLIESLTKSLAVIDDEVEGVKKTVVDRFIANESRIRTQEKLLNQTLMGFLVLMEALEQATDPDASTEGRVLARESVQTTLKAMRHGAGG